MKLKRIALATALAALGLGFAGQASADVYAGSSLKIDQLLINFFAGDFNTTTKTGTSANANVDIRNFQFTLTNNAALNNVGAAPGTNTCFGTIASNNCSAAPAPTLDAAATNAPGSAFNRVNNQTAGADNSFKWFGLGGGNWSNSDSVIYTSELTSAGANPTNTDQIAEANLSSGGSSASGSSLIKSQTGFTFNFTVGGDNPVQVFFDFLADPDLRAEILNELGVAGASGKVGVSIKLSKDGDTDEGFSWAPQGSASNNCVIAADSAGLITCQELADEEDLNTEVGVTTNNTNDVHSYDPNAAGMKAFQLLASGLTAGNWTLDLTAETSIQMNRTAAVPEPASLALISLAMLGLGAGLRRRRN